MNDRKTKSGQSILRGARQALDYAKINNRSALTRADSIVQKLVAIDYGDRQDIDDTLAEQIIAAIGGDYDAWVMIDEHTGRWPEFYREKFWAVRRVRNRPPFSDKLFESFKKG